jgi:Zn-dependent protease
MVHFESESPDGPAVEMVHFELAPSTDPVVEMVHFEFCFKYLVTVLRFTPSSLAMRRLLHPRRPSSFIVSIIFSLRILLIFPPLLLLLINAENQSIFTPQGGAF